MALETGASTFAALLLTLTVSAASAEDNEALKTRGRTLLASHCSRCHAIDRTGTSLHRDAPPFRVLGQRYPIDSLAEALAEGLMSGHPDMPEFVFKIQDVDAILSYLKSIQEPSNPQIR